MYFLLVCSLSLIVILSDVCGFSDGVDGRSLLRLPTLRACRWRYLLGCVKSGTLAWQHCPSSGNASMGCRLTVAFALRPVIFCGSA